MKKTILLIAAVIGYTVSFAQEQIVLSGDELFGSLKARQIGPALMSGRISDLVGHPTNARIIYAGTAGGGVWKSADGGSSFTSIFDKHAQSIGTVAVDPNQPDQVLWVGTGETWTRNSTSVGDGLYKSTDGGVNWTKVGFDKSERISSIQINPKNSDEVYVGVLGPLWGDSDERGVYKTTDGGQTWERLLAGSNDTGCSELILDKNNPNILYAAFWQYRRTAWGFNSGGEKSAMYKSTDGGKTWKKIHNGLPSGKMGRFALAMAPSDSKILYAGVESEKDKGLYKSTDGGESWEYLNKDFGLVVRPFYFSRIVVDPKNPDILLKAGLYASMSRDGGKTFKELGGNYHSDAHDFWFDINNSDRFYIGTDGGVYRTWDAGGNTEMVNNIPVSQFYQVSVDTATPYNVYGGLQDNGSWFGPSSSPGGIEARDWTPVGYGDGFRVLKHPTKPYVYAEMQGAEGVWRYDVERNQTRNVKVFAVEGDPKLRFNWNAPLTQSPNKADRIYLGSQFVHVSNDMGNNWTKISPDLTTNDPKKQNQEESGGISKDNSGAENHCTIFTIAESPLDEKVIWVGTDDGNVQVTQDGGKTWSNVTTNLNGVPANTWCYHIEASNFNKGAAYAVFDGHTANDGNTYVLKTTDFGKTWKSIVTDDIYGFARNIQEDYVNENLLFLGTEFGLYVTIDGGAHWTQFTNNMPEVAVHYIELQPKTNDLVMGTHGRGVIIIDDISPLRELSQDVLNEDVHIFASQPFIMPDESSFGGGSNGSQFIGPNPDRSAKMVYYLKKRHTFGKMTIEVQNQNGQVMQEIDAKKQRGINIVTWNYRMKLPKIAKGKTFDFGGFTAPRVPAGTYTFVMKKGKAEYRHEIELQYDPKSILTLADRKAQEEMVMKLYNMTQDLAYLVFKIDETVDYANMAKDANAKLGKSSAGLIESLNDLKKTLVITTGDNYVGTADKQLREKIGDLYSVVADNYGKPGNGQYANLAILEKTLEEAKTKYSYIKNKELSKLERAGSKYDLGAMQEKSFEQFLKEYK
ncbi:MAG: hypothetical protein KDC79_01760 [Cyclobacteriaceae bacterium]|nr:hypothetical protein [Cyclobacteriaceae bacterium]